MPSTGMGGNGHHWEFARRDESSAGKTFRLSLKLYMYISESADDFCATEPQTDFLELPSGCVYQGSTSIDRGKCETNACYGGTSGQCTTSRTHCCGPASVSRVNIDCDTFSLPVTLVTSCGCARCQQSNVTVYGFAGARDATPLRSGDIYFAGNWTGYTTENGTFSFTVERGVTRASVLFRDSVNREFMDNSYVFEMPDDDHDSQYIRVVLLRRGSTTPLNASEESTLQVNGSVIDIPAESFYTSDGQLYTVSNLKSARNLLHDVPE